MPLSNGCSCADVRAMGPKAAEWKCVVCAQRDRDAAQGLVHKRCPRCDYMFAHHPDLDPEDCGHHEREDW